MMETIFKKNMFTLIELLIVIAIIAILASLLLPALNKAKQKGAGITCLGNLKQLAQLISMYTDDFGGNLPKSCYLKEDNTMQRWDDSIDSLYLFGNRKVFSCPVSVERHEGYFAVTPDTQWSDCYIPNQRVIKYYGFTGDTSCFKANQISHPSGNTLAMDRKVGITRDVGASFPDWPFLDDKVAANGRVGYYHSLGRGVNAVWADGHATWQEGGSLLTSHFTLDGN